MKRKALVIGINEYPTQPLIGAVKDAERMADLLRKNGNGSSNFDVMLRTNITSQGQLRQLVITLFAGDDEYALFYFSGHGYADNDGSWLLTPDAKRYDAGVRLDEILFFANRSKAKQKVIILDCCHSGVLGPLTSMINGAIPVSKGVSILTSCNDESSFEKAHGGVFTSILANALKGWAADVSGNVNLISVYYYVDQLLGAWQQRPQLITNVSTTPILRTVTPLIPLESIRTLVDYFTTPESVYSIAHERSNLLNDASLDNAKMEAHFQQFEKANLIVIADDNIVSSETPKSFKLSSLGEYYWQLTKTGKL